MSVLVCGGRSYNDYRKVCEVLNDVWQQSGEALTIIEGGANGADHLASLWSLANQHVKLVTYKANWTEHGKSAGVVRNNKMLKEGKPDLVVAFPGGRGTAHMVSIAEKAGVKVMRIED